MLHPAGAHAAPELKVVAPLPAVEWRATNEIFFFDRSLPHSGQVWGASASEKLTRFSNGWPQPPHTYSYMGTEDLRTQLSLNQHTGGKYSRAEGAWPLL